MAKRQKNRQHNGQKTEEQTTQWPKERNKQHNGKEKGQKNKQRSTKHTHKTKDQVTRTPLKTGGELMCSGRVTVPAPLVSPISGGHMFSTVCFT